MKIATWGNPLKKLSTGEMILLPAIPPEVAQPMTLRFAAATAAAADLMDASGQKAEVLQPLEKLNRYRLAQKIQDASPETDFTMEELVMIKQLLGRAYGIEIYGQCHDLLEAQ